MNAVKNCLVVLVAAVALASCSADPTKDLGGKNLVLNVTPGSVNARVGDTLEVFASAQDALGGAAFGNFSITGGSGANFTAKIDSSYNPVYAGTRPQGRTRIVVAALHASNGSFTISGTGGNFVVPVRIAPDSTNGEAVVSKTNLASVDTFTVTLPAGIRVTSGFTVQVYHNALSGDSALFSPTATAVSADSSTVTVAVGPNSNGKVRLGGVANATTPTLTYAMRTAAEVVSPTLDTSGTDTAATVNHLRLSTSTPGLGDTVTATLPVGWRFTPGSKVHLYNGPTATDSNDGQAQPVTIGIGPDSSTLKFVPGPSGQGQARFTGVVAQLAPLQYVYPAVRSLDTLTVPPLPTTGTIVVTRADNNPNTRAGITLPALYSFSATSGASVSGSSLKPVVLSTSAAGDTLYTLLTPGSNGTVSFTGVKWSVFSGLAFSSTNSVTTAAASDQGNDDPTAGPVPTLSLPAQGKVALWDIGTFSVQDHSDDAGGPGINSQVYQVTLGVAATLVATVSYPSSAADIDVVILQGSGSTNLPDVATGGETAAHPEVATAAGLSAGTYLVDLIDYGPAFGPGLDAVGKTLSLVVVAK